MKKGIITRSARQIHSWVGAIVAVFIIVIALSGTLLIWKDTYLRLVFPQPDQTIDVDAVTRIALAAEAAFGVDGIISASIDHDTQLARLSLANSQAAYIAMDGTVMDVWAPNGRPEEWLLDLHHQFLSGTRGLYVSGFIGIAALVTIIFGLIAFWPARRAWGQGMALRGKTRPHMLTAHRNNGVWLAAPLSILIFSGVVLTFPDTARAIFLWHTDYDSFAESFATGVDDLEGRTEATWSRAITRATAVFPDGRITGLIWPINGNERNVLIRDAGEWNETGNSSVQITVPDGYMDLRIAAADLPVGERAYNSMSPLHKSELGGWIYNAVQTIIGLGFIWLGLLGLVSFLRKLRQS